MDIKEFKDYCLEMIAQRNKCEDMRKALSLENEKLDAMKLFITNKLQEFGLDKFDTGGGLVYKVNKMNVKISDRSAFFDYLRKENIFDELASVNFQTLNAFYREKMDEAVRNGESNFNLPGIQESSIFTTVQIRSGK